jgi:hypothetical protein
MVADSIRPTKRAWLFAYKQVACLVAYAILVSFLPRRLLHMEKRVIMGIDLESISPIPAVAIVVCMRF